MSGNGPGVDFGMSANADEVVRALDKIIRGQNKVLEGFQRTASESRTAGSQIDGFSSRFTSQLTGLVTGLASVNGAINLGKAAFSDWKGRIDASVDSMKRFQEAYLQFQFLGENYKDPSHRARMFAISNQSGIPAEQLSVAFARLQSDTGYLEEKPGGLALRGQMASELVRLKRTSPVPMEQLVPTYTKMGALYQNLSAREMTNIQKYLLEASSGDPFQISEYAPYMFASGQVGKTDARTAAAVGAFLTNKTGTVAQAAQGMDTLFKKVMLADPDDNELLQSLAGRQKLRGKQKLLEEAGIGEGDDAYARLMKLSPLYAQGKLGASELKSLFGERGMRYAGLVLGDPTALEQMRQRFYSKTGADQDIVGTQLAGVEKSDPYFAASFAGQKIQSETESARQAPLNMAYNNYYQLLERQRQANKIGYIDYKLSGFSTGLSQWFSGNQEDVIARTVGAMSLHGEIPEGTSPTVARQKAMETLGLLEQPSAGMDVPRGQNIDELTRALFDGATAMKSAAEKLDKSATRVANANAHTE